MSTRTNSSQREHDRRILKRGEPACAICGQPIDYTLKTPDPMSFEADHIVPLILGGSDTIDNKQPSHRRCNRAKHGKLVAPVVRRCGSLA